MIGGIAVRRQAMAKQQDRETGKRVWRSVRGHRRSPTLRREGVASSRVLRAQSGTQRGLSQSRMDFAQCEAEGKRALAQAQAQAAVVAYHSSGKKLPQEHHHSIRIEETESSSLLRVGSSLQIASYIARYRNKLRICRITKKN